MSIRRNVSGCQVTWGNYLCFLSPKGTSPTTRENGPGGTRTRICDLDRVLCSHYTTGPECSFLKAAGNSKVKDHIFTLLVLKWDAAETHSCKISSERVSVLKGFRWQPRYPQTRMAFVPDVEAYQHSGDLLDDAGILKSPAIQSANSRNFARQFANALSRVFIITTDDYVTIDWTVLFEKVSGQIMKRGDHDHTFGHKLRCLLRRRSLPDA